MPIPHRRIRGKIHYTSDKPDRVGVERGREYFTMTFHGSGHRTLRAYTEIDDAPNVTAKYGVRSVPTVIVFKGGQKSGQHVGLTNRDKLIALLGLN